MLMLFRKNPLAGAIFSACSLIAAALFIQGCGPEWQTNPTTTYREFLTAEGTVLAANAKSAVEGLTIGAFNWITTFSDGSTVANPFIPRSALTNSTGKFGFASSQLQLFSGNQEEVCDQVCVDWQTATQDVCVNWQQSCYDSCSDWGQTCTDTCTSYDYDADGNKYCVSYDTTCTDTCNNWVTNCSDTCINWSTETYSYCTAYAEDCGYIYPTRSVTDIVSASSEITYDNGSGPITVASEGAALTPNAALISTETATQTERNVNRSWLQKDTYVTEIEPAASSAPALSAARQSIVAARNASKPRVTLMKAGKPNLSRVHATPKFFKSDKLNTMNSSFMTKLQETRSKANAFEKGKF